MQVLLTLRLGFSLLVCFAGCQLKSNQAAQNERIKNENIFPQIPKNRTDLMQNHRNMDRLKEILSTADSVSIVSHKLLEKYNKYKDIYFPLLLEEEKPNAKIIQEKTVSATANQRELIKILSKEPTGAAKYAACFTPYHAIFIFKNNVTSYINICFTCQRIETSRNINLREGDFDDDKWELLKKFFKELGIKKFYE